MSCTLAFALWSPGSVPSGSLNLQQGCGKPQSASMLHHSFAVVTCAYALSCTNQRTKEWGPADAAMINSWPMLLFMHVSCVHHLILLTLSQVKPPGFNACSFTLQ
jgi:hypothetical protein